MVRDPITSKCKRARLFVLTLGYSRKCVRLLTWRSSAQIWAELHERAFRRLGGTVKVIVPDNLGEGVLTPDIYDPTLNPLYRDVLAHYGVVALPCRVGDPDRKGKVEAGVGHAQKTPLKGLRFESLEAAQAYLDRWEPTGPTLASTAPRNASSPRCLPRSGWPSGRCRSSRFAFIASGVRTIQLDGCVEVDAAYHGAPPGWIGRRVDVQWNDLHVRLLDSQTRLLLREHLRAPRGWHRIATRIIRHASRRKRLRCWPPRRASAPRSAPSGVFLRSIRMVVSSFSISSPFSGGGVQSRNESMTSWRPINSRAG
jgi:hypothetical protein